MPSPRCLSSPRSTEAQPMPSTVHIVLMHVRSFEPHPSLLLMDNTRLTKEGLWRAVLGDATGAPAKPAAPAAAAAKGKGKEKETEKPVKEAESCFLFKRKFLKYVVLASA